MAFDLLSQTSQTLLYALRQDEASPDLTRRTLDGRPKGHGYVSRSGSSGLSLQAGGIVGPSTVNGPQMHSLSLPPPPPSLQSSNEAHPNEPQSHDRSQLAPLVFSHSLPLPLELSRRYGSVQVSSFMGLLPEANLSYLTIDSDLYLWEYSSNATGSSDASGSNFSSNFGSNFGSNFSSDMNIPNIPSSSYVSFTGLTECIISVSLVPPRPNVFKENVRHLVACCTCDQIILLALKDDPAVGGFRLLPTKFTTGLDQSVLSVRGDYKTGRIFMGQKDGKLSELVYEGNNGSGASSATTTRRRCPRRSWSASTQPRSGGWTRSTRTRTACWTRASAIRV